MFGFLWDLQQDRLIAQAQTRADHAAIDAAATAQRIEELVRENERLQTITMASCPGRGNPSPYPSG